MDSGWAAAQFSCNRGLTSSGGSPRLGVMLLTELFSEYLVHLHVYGRPGTLETAEYRIKALEHHFCLPTHIENFGDRQTAQQLVSWYICARKFANIADSTINSELRLLRTALTRGGITSKYVQLLKEGRRLPIVLTPTQIAILQHHACAPFETMLLLAWKAGLRQGEILHLHKRDISPLGIRICAKPEVNWKPKSHHERDVPIHDSTWNMLCSHLDTPGPWLFPGQDPSLPRSQVGYAIRRIFRAANLYEPRDKPGLHMLRRSWATTLLATGTDIETVRQLGGWASLHIVQKYVTSNDAQKREAIRRLE